GQVDGAHAAATEQVDNDVLAEDEALVAPLKQLLGLKSANQSLVNEFGGGLPWVGRQGRGVRYEGGDSLRRRNSALDNEFEQIERRFRGYGHGRSLSRMARTTDARTENDGLTR